jgi:preprotein translocase subunit YajC
VGGETLNALLAFLNRGYNVFVSSHFSVRLGYLLAFDNMIIPVVVFGLLAYFASLSTRQVVMKVTVVAGIWLPAIAILASSFLCGIHGSIEFFEELLCAIIWLWICIGLMQFIRDKQKRQKMTEQSIRSSL